MKTNLNFYYSSLIVDTLYELGIRQVCISPGSRSTPITLAFARDQRIKKNVIVDERASAFFALGLSKLMNQPVAIVCTSGTAVAELYPAIIEAFNSQVPLVVITADRPSRLLNTGSNQTIIQKNIFEANCKHFVDLGIPENTESFFVNTIFSVTQAYSEAVLPFQGPVHINIPLEKPLEPNSFDVEIDDEMDDRLREYITKQQILDFFVDRDESYLNEIEIEPSKKTIILLGNDDYSWLFLTRCISFGEKYKVPVCVESPLKYSIEEGSRFIKNFGNLLQSAAFSSKLDVDQIIVFGRNFTSKNVERFIDKFDRTIVRISIKGEGFGITSEERSVLQISNDAGLMLLNKSFANVSADENPLYQFLHRSNSQFLSLLNKRFENVEITSELETMGLIGKNLVTDHFVPILLSNSLPVRDYDYLKSLFPDSVLVNRGASGIDGILATACGVSSFMMMQTVVILGDLAFHYDSNSLQIIKKYSIPLLVILFNNGGGSIFEYLPVYEKTEEFSEFFKTATGLNFGKIVEAYGIDYKLVTTSDDLTESVAKFIKTPSPTVLEFQFDSTISKERKDKIKNEIISSLKISEV